MSVQICTVTVEEQARAVAQVLRRRGGSAFRLTEDQRKAIVDAYRRRERKRWGYRLLCPGVRR